MKIMKRFLILYPTNSKSSSLILSAKIQVVNAFECLLLQLSGDTL